MRVNWFAISVICDNTIVLTVTLIIKLCNDAVSAAETNIWQETVNDERSGYVEVVVAAFKAKSQHLVLAAELVSLTVAYTVDRSL